MRIAHLLPYDLRQPGGVQTHTLALSEGLRRLGHESVVFGPERAFRVSLGGTRADLAFHPGDLLKLREFLRRPHDILHIQEPMLPMLGPLGLLHPGGAPVVVTLHSAEALAGRFYRSTATLTRFLLRRADAIICATAVSRDVAAASLPRAPELIPPCLDLSAFRAVSEQREPGLVLFVGRDEPRKGLSVIVSAMKRLPHARLVVAGPVRESTRRSAGAQTTFLGAVPHEQIPQLLATASCAVFPATGGEALGLVLIEAMASGLPVIASDIPGYRIASDDGRSAVLTPANDPAALAQHIEALLNNDPRRAELAALGRCNARRFDADTVAQQHLDLYHSLVQPYSG